MKQIYLKLSTLSAGKLFKRVTKQNPKFDNHDVYMYLI